MTRTAERVSPAASERRAPAPPARGARRRRRFREGLEGWGFVIPALVIVLGLSIFPAVWAFFLSLQKWNGFSPAESVGLANYQGMVTDTELQDAVLHTVLYVVLFVPFVASAAVTGILTTYLFNPQFGLVNNALRVLGLPQQGWLEDQSQAMVVITIMSLRGQAAFTTVIFLAALQDTPVELLEAARIDGANRWQSFWSVVWPQLAPVTVFVGIWQMVGAIQLFDLVYTTTRGGPLNATQTVVYYLWQTAFQKLQFGYGSAVAYGIFAVTLLATIGVVLYSRRTRIEAF
jgi:multiple sugar transport system permease protein